MGPECRFLLAFGKDGAELGGPESQSVMTSTFAPAELGKMERVSAAKVAYNEAKKMATTPSLLGAANSPMLAIDGEVEIYYPCVKDSRARLGLEVNLPGMRIADAAVTLLFKCDTTATKAKPVEMFKFFGGIRLVQLGSLSITNVKIKGSRWRDFQNETWVDVTVSGEIEMKSLGLKIKVAVAVDTKKGTVKITIEMKWRKEFAGGRSVEVQGAGGLTIPCKKLGDLHVGVKVAVKNLGLEFLDDLEGRGSFQSNCGDAWSVNFEIAFKASKPMDIFPGFSLWLPDLISIMASQNKEALRVRLGITYGVMEIAIGAIFSKKKGAGTTFFVGIHIARCTVQDFVDSLDKLLPGENVGESNPMGANAAADAELGERMAALGRARGKNYTAAELGVAMPGLKRAIMTSTVPEINIVIEYNTKTGLIISMSIRDVDVFGIRLDLGALVAKSSSGGWGFWFYVGFLNFENGMLKLPPRLRPIQDIVNIPLKMISQSFVSLGFQFASKKIMLPNGFDDSHLPIRVPVIMKGLNVVAMINANKQGRRPFEHTHTPHSQAFINTIRLFSTLSV